MPSALPSALDARLSADPWLGSILGSPAYRASDAGALANLLTTGGSDAANAWRRLLAADAFVSTKVPTEKIGVTQTLERHGFRLVDTNVTFDKPINRFAPQDSRSAPASDTSAESIEIRLARPEDEGATTTLARNSFGFSRFHQDPAIPAGIANRIKAEWAANFFRGQRGDAMVLGFCDGQPAGFLQLLVPGTERLVIDLVAVAEPFRRRGLAGRMIVFAESTYPQAERIQVGTQIANVPSVRCYEGLGFRLQASAYVLHCYGTR